jgi:hypothetical protein
MMCGVWCVVCVERDRERETAESREPHRSQITGGFLKKIVRHALYTYAMSLSLCAAFYAILPGKRREIFNDILKGSREKYHRLSNHSCGHKDQSLTDISVIIARAFVKPKERQ